MKFTLSFLFLLSFYYALSQRTAFDTLIYDKVKAYEFDGSHERLITYCLKKEKSRINKDKLLSKELIKEFEKIITSKGSYGAYTAACFEPHLAIVYYNDNQIVEVVDVCLSCNYLKSSVEIPALSEIKVDSFTEYERPLSGFNKETRKKLDGFLKKLEFDKYTTSIDSIFDE